MQVQEREAEAPSCRDCIFGPINDSGQGNCDHIAHWERRRDFVAGKWIARNVVTTAEARGDDGLCGPEGLLFHPYTLPRRVAKLLSRTDPFWLFVSPLLAVGLVVAVATGH